MHWYHSSNPGLSTLVNELAQAYSRQRIPVLSLICAVYYGQEQTSAGLLCRKLN